VPSTNELAKLYAINPATAAKGVNILVDEGVLYKKRGIGMFVSAGAKEAILSRRKNEFYDNYVKKQKEDIEELASLFKGMLGEEKDEDDYVERLKSHFFPMEGLKAVFRIDLVEEKSSLIIDINDSKLNCYRGTVEQADVTAKVKTAVFEQVLDGTKTFQSAFMSGELSAQGNFKILRNFDTIFRFQNI
jgi:putative sterol carrier protein